MAKLMDFEKLRKKRQRSQAVRRVAVIAALAAAIVGVVKLNDYLIDIGFSTRVGDLVASYGGGGYPVQVPGGIIRDVKTLDGGLAVLNDTSLYIYNGKGKVIGTFQKMTDSTVLLTADKRAIAYDVGKRRLAVYSRSKELHTMETEYGIQSASMNAQGDFAVVTTSRQYLAQVTVYDRQFQEVAQWYSSDNVVIDTALSPKGDRMLAACATTKGGALQTVLLLFDFTAGEETARLELDGEMPLRAEYLTDGRIGVLTDGQYLVLTAGGARESSYDFAGRSLLAYERQDRDTLLLFDASPGCEAVLLDAGCVEKAALRSEEKVADMALNSKRVYLLTDKGIAGYNAKLERQDELRQNGITDIHLAGGKLYFLTREEICVLSQ